MQLTLWTYEGPPHVGAMRIAAAMDGLHYVLHAPQGDTYADLLFTMIERQQKRPPVTYTTFQARDLGGDTADLFKRAARRCLRTLQAAGDDRRRLLHGGTDPGRSGRPCKRAGAADPGDPARTAILSEEGKLGRVGDILPDRPRTRGPARRRTRERQAGPPSLQYPRRNGARLPPSRRCHRDHQTARPISAST